ncbi:LptA/OstA family protein [Roseomonas sp. E05]|uniref:LptA/OstA family protein n=1 Tax=Roseomonas sp. E05 TaxID=3046310 RepID=UPI0024BA3D9C|nr:LptA/OstA family protein [Roseomonas sp. E05]MDJ0390429.1 LptA/OstA family protein [Roseomonas sp. E05]
MSARHATLVLLAVLALPATAAAQALDLTEGGPIEVTASNGIEWRQQEQVVIARGNARAVREGVTLTADRLIARYRPRAGQPAATPAPAEAPMSGGEIWRLEAEGNVKIDSATEHAEGDRAIYDMDQAVLVMTGRALKLTTPQDVLTARDSLEYWPQKHMAVARGAAHVVTEDQRQIFADTLVGYFQDRDAAPQAARADSKEGSQLERVEAFGNVEIRTPTEVVRGDRGVYSELTGMARLLGGVRITRGDNQLNGQEAIVNMRSGVARLVSTPGQRVQGLIIPQQGQQALQPQSEQKPEQKSGQGRPR